MAATVRGARRWSNARASTRGPCGATHGAMERVDTIVAGAATAWLAVASDDGLVADDYYKRGLAINQELRRERAAAARGLVARIVAGQGELRLRLEGRGALPEALFVKLAHATRAGFDLRLRLENRGGGLYECALPQLAAGHWRVAIEDPRGEWRIVGEWPGDARQHPDCSHPHPATREQPG